MGVLENKINAIYIHFINWLLNSNGQISGWVHLLEVELPHDHVYRTVGGWVSQLVSQLFSVRLS